MLANQIMCGNGSDREESGARSSESVKGRSLVTKKIPPSKNVVDESMLISTEHY